VDLDALDLHACTCAPFVAGNDDRFRGC
jgi:hypothetical protein